MANRKRFGMDSKLVTAMDLPLKSEVKERPERVPTFGSDVLGPTMLFFFVGSMLGFGLYTLFVEWPVVIPRMMLAGFILGGIVAVLVGLYQLVYVFDVPITSWQEREWQEVASEDENEERDEVVWVQGGGPDAGRVMLGGFSFKASEWKKLAETLVSADGKVVRSVLEEAGVFINLSKNYNNYLAEMERLNLVKDNEVTDEGWEFFGRFTPLPHEGNGGGRR